MKLIDPHQCGGPEFCKVRLLDLDNAVAVFGSRMSAGVAFSCGYYHSRGAGGRIANILSMDVDTPLGTVVREQWYVCFKAQLYWHFGKIYNHPAWGIGVSVPLDMLMEAKYRKDAKIAVMHDIDVCYGMRASEWLKWAEENHTIDLNQKPDKSAGVALKFMQRVF